MKKRIEIKEKQYDWLMARGKGEMTLEMVIWEVIDLVERIEADQAKYKAWKTASMPGFKAKKVE